MKADFARNIWDVNEMARIEKGIKVVRSSDPELLTGEVGWSVKPLISNKYANSEKIWMGWVNFEPNGKHDWHTHEEEDEALIVIAGEIAFYYKRGDKVIEEKLKEGDAAFVPMKLEHKFENSAKPLIAIVGKAPSPSGAGR